MGQRLLSNQFLIFISFLSIYFIWGTTYLAIRIGLEDLPAFMMAGIRFFIAGILLIAYSLWYGQRWPKYQSMVKNAVFALIIMVGGQGLLMWSEQYIASGYASVLVATIPLWFVILDNKNWKLYFSNPFIIAGVVLGFIGILTLFGEKITNQGLITSSDEITATVLVIFGAICWVYGTLLYRSNPPKDSLYANLGWQFTFASIYCLMFSWVLGEFPNTHFSAVNATSWISIVYLSVFGSIVGLIAYTWLLTQKPAAVVGTYAFINPIIAVLIGWLFADEYITSFQFIGMLIIVLSAVLINIKRAQVLEK